MENSVRKNKNSTVGGSKRMPVDKLNRRPFPVYRDLVYPSVGQCALRLVNFSPQFFIFSGTVYRAWKRLPEWIHPFLWCIMIRVIFFYRFFMIQVILIQITPKGTHPKFSGGQFSALSRDSLRCYGTRVNVLTREKTTVIRLLSPGEVAIHVNLAPSCYRNRDKQSAANFINWLIWQPNKERCNFTFVKTTVQNGRGMNEWIDWTP